MSKLVEKLEYDELAKHFLRNTVICQIAFVHQQNTVKCQFLNSILTLAVKISRENFFNCYCRLIRVVSLLNCLKEQIKRRKKLHYDCNCCQNQDENYAKLQIRKKNIKGRKLRAKRFVKAR